MDVEKAVDRALTVAGRGRTAGALDKETLRKYQHSWREAATWYRSVGLSAMPWTSETLAQYAGVLLELGYAASTVDFRLAGVKAEHRRRGLPVPDGVAAWYVLRAAKDTAEDPGKVNTRLPRRAGLARAAAELDPATAAGARDLCLAALGWDLMALVAALTDVDLADVQTVAGGPDGDEFLSVRLRGRWLPVRHLHDPVSVCPVEATQAWMGHLYRAGVHEGPLFRAVDKGGNIAGAGKYAGHQSALRLTPGGLRRIWSTIAVKGGMPPTTAKDLRFASSLEAAAAGVPLTVILDRGGWAPTGPVLARLYAASQQALEEEGTDGGADVV